MDLTKLLASTGGGDSVRKLASQLGLDLSDAGKMIEAVAPALQEGLQKQATTSKGLIDLQRALQSGNHERYLDNPELLEREETREDGNAILGHLFGSKEVSRQVASQASARTGIDTGLIKKALPLLAGLTMGAMRKGTKSEDLPQRGAPADGGLGALASMLGGGKSSRLSDVIGFARKFF